MRKHRVYEMVRDGQGMPTKLVWIGDYEMPSQKDLDRQKLAEHEKIYGKRESNGPSAQVNS